jgi:hypothetical protein
MNTPGKIYIYDLTKQNQHLNNKHTIAKNSNFGYNNHIKLKTKHKPWKTLAEQATQSSKTHQITNN